MLIRLNNVMLSGLASNQLKKWQNGLWIIMVFLQALTIPLCLMVSLRFVPCYRASRLTTCGSRSHIVGCGNAHLLLLLAESGYSPHQLTGVDYSEASIELSKAIVKEHETEEDFSGIKLEAVDVIQDDYSRNGTNQYDLVLDKGVCIMPSSRRTFSIRADVSSTTDL